MLHIVSKKFSGGPEPQCSQWKPIQSNTLCCVASLSLCFLSSPQNKLLVPKSLSRGLLLRERKFRARITGRRESQTAWLGPHWGSPCLSRPRELEGLGARCPVLPGENQPWGTENGKQPHGPVPELLLRTEQSVTKIVLLLSLVESCQYSLAKGCRKRARKI